jgi:TolA-binding protein
MTLKWLTLMFVTGLVLGAAAPRSLAQGSDEGPPGVNAATIELRFQRLGDEIRDLTGQIQDLQHQIDEMKARLDRRSSDVDMRLQALEHATGVGGGGNAATDQP